MVEVALNELAATGGRGGRPLAPRSVQLTAVTLRAALDFAQRQGYVSQNVARLASAPRVERKPMGVWSRDEARQFTTAVRGERDGALFILATIRGLRRGELAGLRWGSVHLDAGYLQVVESRVLAAGGQVIASGPKTKASRRRIPLDPGLVTVLREHRRRQLEDRIAAGTAWRDGDYVFTNPIGEPLKPDHISDRFAKLCRRAAVPVIRLHDCRHTAATVMLELGVHPRVVQEMLGHSSVQITLDISRM